MRQKLARFQRVINVDLGRTDVDHDGLRGARELIEEANYLTVATRTEITRGDCSFRTLGSRLSDPQR